jgi:predicted DNA-binding protein
MLQRTQISLSDEDRRLLDAESARTGKSLSALIRDAVVEVYGDKRDLAADLAVIEAVAGAWKDRDEDGFEYVERMRPGTRFAHLYEQQ